MRIIVCFEGRIRPDSTGFYLLPALRSLGHEVTHITPDEIMSVKPGDADIFIKCDDGLSDRGWNPALHPSAYIVIDTHIESDWRVKLAADGKFDLVTVAQHDGLKLPWVQKSIYNPLGCDQDKHYAGIHDKKYDGCFIGNFHNGLSGPRIEMLDAFFKACHGPIFFGARGPDQFPAIYAQSKLVFNRSINGDLNMRVFEALCSGSCLVTDKVPDLDRVGLVDGIHYAGYTDKENLERVVKDLISDDEKRERIAANGRAASFQHSYAKRMEVLLDALNLTKGEKEHGYAIR